MKQHSAGFLLIPVAVLALFFPFWSQMFAQETSLSHSAQTPAQITRMPVFAPPVDYSLVTTAAALAQADFNDDGKSDLAVGSYVSPSCDSDTGTVTIYLGNGDGTFPTSGSSSFNSGGACPGTVLAADFNGDGKIDLAVANYSSSGTNGGVNIFLGNGDGTFTAAGSYDPGNSAIATLGDFNGDGIMDIAVGDTTHMGVDILLGNGDGSFRLAGNNPLSDYVGSVYVTDLNLDGKQDLVVASGGQGGYFYVLQGKGDGTFRRPARHSVPSGFTSIAVADFNDDGKPDIGFAEQELFCDGASKGFVGVALGNGDGTFQRAIITNSTDRCAYNGTVAGDFNVDGKMDLLAESAVSSPVGSRLFLGQGNGSFQPPENLSCLGGFGSAGTVVSDLNMDGAPDLVLLLQGGTGFCVQLNESGVVARLTSSLNPSKLGQAVTFTATVTPTFPLQGTPTGMIKFRDGNTVLGTVALTSGSAALTTSSLTVGKHKIHAAYSGDSVFVPVHSPAIIQIVRP